MALGMAGAAYDIFQGGGIENICFPFPWNFVTVCW